MERHEEPIEQARLIPVETRKRKILVVDDTADLLELTTTILEMADYETFSFAMKNRKSHSLRDFV